MHHIAKSQTRSLWLGLIAESVNVIVCVWCEHIVTLYRTAHMIGCEDDKACDRFGNMHVFVPVCLPLRNV